MKRILAIFCTVLTVVGAVCDLLAQSTTGERGGLTTGAATPTFKNIYALIVGISKYDNRNIKDLRFAGDDAKLFYTYLLAAYPNQVKPDNIRLLVDEQATGTEIERNLAWLRDQASENDLVIFFFAGHGGIDNIGINQGQAYLIPYKSSLASLNDSRAIKIAEVDDLMNNQISVGKKATTICILDACHAGNSTNNQQTAGDINKRLSQQQGNVIKILASRANQLANEDPLLCGGHGVFTYFLIKGLLKEADKNGDNRISLSEMNDFLPGKVREKTSERQDPMVQYQNDLALNGWQGVSKEEFDCLLDKKTGTAKAIAYAVYDEKKLIAGHLNETQKRHYEQFSNALAEHRYLEPAASSVLHYYNILRDDGVNSTILNQIQSQWKVAFQDHAQELILAYLEERPIQAYTEYEKAAQMVSRVLEASQPTESDYKRIQARQIWLASYTESQKIGLGIYKNSQNDQRKQRQAIISNVKRAIELDPEAAYLYNALGYNLERVGEKEQAKAAYRKAIELAPRWTYPRNNLGVVLNNPEEKIKLYEECVHLNPEMELAYCNLAPQYLAQGDTLKCRQMLDKALALCIREKSASYRLSLAWTYQQYAALYKKRDNRQLAEYYYKLAIENSDLNDIDSRLTLAEYYCELFETNKVDALLKGIMENWAKDARPYATLGYKNTKIGDWANAANYYEQAVERDSENEFYHYMLSITYRQLNKYDLALQHITTSLRIDPSDPDYLSERGNIWIDQKDYNKALEDHRNALALSPKSANIYTNLGFVYLNKKEYAEAERCFRKAVDLDSRSAYYYKNLGYTLYLQKRNPEALATYRQALRISPTWNDIWTHICDAYRSMNQLDSAVYALNQGVELNGYMKEHKYEEARKQFLDAVKRTDYVFNYYALGYLYEKGFGVPQNLELAIHWYKYASQMGSSVASQKLIQLYQSKKIQGENAQKTIERLRKNIDKGLKRFTIPATLADGNKAPVDLFISDFPSDPNEPIADEIRRIREVRQATIDQKITDSFGKLYDIAVKNNVSYQDLCVYAMDAANDEKVKSVARAINYPAKALEAIGNNRLDSLTSYMRQAVVSYLGVDLNDSEKSAQRLLDSLRSGTSQPGLFYYALGYLYEHKPSGRAWSKAENYYRYSFQTGYAPAYFRLLTRFTREIPSTSQANWLRDNYNRGFKGFLVTTYQPDSTSKKLNLYVHDFPQDVNDPVADERKRLQDIFGVALAPSLQTRFADLYKESQTNRRSFQQQVQLTVDASSPNSTSTESNEAVGKLIKQADKLYEDSKYKEAAPLYLKAIEQTKDKSLLAEYWVKVGNTMMLTKEHSFAQKCYKVSVSINPTAWAYYCSGYDYVMQTKVDSAVIRYKQAIELNPSRATYHLELGRLYYDQKDYQAAINTLTRARQLDSTNTQTLNTLGISLTYAKRYAEGLSVFRKAIELNPSSAGIFIYNIACNYALQGRNTEALNNLEEALKRKYSNYEDINKDSDFALLKNTEGFKQLMAKYFPAKK